MLRDRQSHAHMQTGTQICTHRQVHRCSDSLVHAHSTLSCMHTREYTNTCTQTWIYTHKHMCTDTHVSTHQHTRTQTWTHTCTCANSQTWTHTKIYSLPQFLCLQSSLFLTRPCTTHFSLGPGVPSSLSGTQPRGACCPAPPNPSVPCMFCRPWDYAQSCLSAALSPGSPPPPGNAALAWSGVGALWATGQWVETWSLASPACRVAQGEGKSKAPSQTGFVEALLFSNHFPGGFLLEDAERKQLPESSRLKGFSLPPNPFAGKWLGDGGEHFVPEKQGVRAGVSL